MAKILKNLIYIAIRNKQVRAELESAKRLYFSTALQEYLQMYLQKFWRYLSGFKSELNHIEANGNICNAPSIITDSYNNFLSYVFVPRSTKHDGTNVLCVH